MFLLLFLECWYCEYRQPPSSMQSWGSTPGPHVCEANILPTEPHLQLQMLIFEHILWIFNLPVTYDLTWCYVIYCVVEAGNMCMCRHQRTTARSQFSPATWLTQGSSHLWCCVIHTQLVILWPTRQSWECRCMNCCRHNQLFTEVWGSNSVYHPGQQVILLTEPSPYPYSAILDQIFFISKWILL